MKKSLMSLETPRGAPAVTVRGNLVVVALLIARRYKLSRVLETCICDSILLLQKSSSYDTHQQRVTRGAWMCQEAIRPGSTGVLYRVIAGDRNEIENAVWISPVSYYVLWKPAGRVLGQFRGCNLPREPCTCAGIWFFVCVLSP
jgi:hypothetical protein